MSDKHPEDDLTSSSLWINSTGDLVHPNAPAGGGGAGPFTQTRSLGLDEDHHTPFAHPFSPAGRLLALNDRDKKHRKGKDAPAATQQTKPTDSAVETRVLEAAARLAGHKDPAQRARTRPANEKSECWDLPQRLLEDNGGQTSNDLTSKAAFDAGDYVWGDPIQGPEPGAIAQFRDHKITLHTDIEVVSQDGTYHNTGGWVEENHIRGPIHSAVVLSVESSSEMAVAEQHVRDPQTGKQSGKVQRGKVYLKDQTLPPRSSVEDFKDPDTGQVYHHATVTRTVKITVTGKVTFYRPKAK
jgi:hypothetical protein